MIAHTSSCYSSSLQTLLRVEFNCEPVAKTSDQIFGLPGLFCIMENSTEVEALHSLMPFWLVLLKITAYLGILKNV